MEIFENFCASLGGHQQILQNKFFEFQKNESKNNFFHTKLSSEMNLESFLNIKNIQIQKKIEFEKAAGTKVWKTALTFEDIRDPAEDCALLQFDNDQLAALKSYPIGDKTYSELFQSSSSPTLSLHGSKVERQIALVVPCANSQSVGGFSPFLDSPCSPGSPNRQQRLEEKPENEGVRGGQKLQQKKQRTE